MVGLSTKCAHGVETLQPQRLCWRAVSNWRPRALPGGAATEANTGLYKRAAQAMAAFADGCKSVSAFEAAASCK